MDIIEMIKKHKSIKVMNTGKITTLNGSSLGNVSPTFYQNLESHVNSNCKMSDITVSVKKCEDGLTINYIPSQTQQIPQTQHENSSSYDIRFKINELSNEMVEMLSHNPVVINNEQFNSVRTASEFLLKKIDVNSNGFTTLESLIQYAASQNAKRLFVDSTTAYIVINDTVKPINVICTETYCEKLIDSLGAKYYSTLKENNSITENIKYDTCTASIQCVYDTKTTIIVNINYAKVFNLGDFFDEEWCTGLKDRILVDKGALAIVTEKIDYPEAHKLLLETISNRNMTLVLYDKPNIFYDKCNTHHFNSSIPLENIRCTDANILMMDIMHAKNNWDVIFDFIEEGTCVILTTTETTIPAVLDLVLALLDEKYKKRKLTQCLYGINVITKVKKDSACITKYDYVYNNQHFVDVINSETYDRVELMNKKYKTLFSGLTSVTKTIKEEIEGIFAYLNQVNAHDISLTAGSPPRYRIGKTLVTGYTEKKLTPEILEMIYMELVPRMQDREKFKRDPSEGISCSYSLPSIGRFRVSIYRQRGSIAISARIIHETIMTLEQCGLDQHFLDDLAIFKQGLLLITGTMGSGKTTTLTAIVDYYNETRQGKIVLDEDPIEYLHKHKKCIVEQQELGTDTNSLEDSLRRMLRNDVDILVIGEIRTPAVLQLALEISSCGALVLGTFHTKNAISTITRAIDMFPAESRDAIKMTLSENLLGVFTQSLVPRKDGTGSVIASEYMKVNPTISSIISKNGSESLGKLIDQIRNQSNGNFNHSMDEDLTRLYRSGIISKEDYELYLQDKSTVRRM